MTAAAQHDFHPDAEMLNAFAGQALPERERAKVLAHLAVCGRCRQVLVLAQQAALAEAAPERAAASPVLQGAWWRRWRIVWIPATIAAAFTVASISYQLRQAEPRDKEFRIEIQPASPNTASTTAPPQAELAESAPSPSPPPAARADSRSLSQNKALAPRTRLPSFPEAAVPHTFEGAYGRAVPPSANETVSVVQDRPELAPVAPAQQPVTDQLAEAGSPVLYKTPPSAIIPRPQKKAQQQAVLAEQQKQIEAAALQNHLFGANAALQPDARGTSNGAVTSDNSPATFDRQQLEMRAESAAAAATVRETPVSRNDSLRLLHLPSGLAVASFAFAGHRGVAIDSAGSVFVSQDVGSVWKLVNPQWTGRAILVRTKTLPPPPKAAPPAPAAANDATASVAIPSNAPFVAFFEIVNDKNQVWRSTDGTTWTAK